MNEAKGRAMRLRKVINFSETRTRRVLVEAAERHGVEVLPKQQLAGALEIAGSGLSDDLYRYALQAHFDFLVVDEEAWPLFAVELDGPSHDDEKVRRRDRRKNRICEAFGLPLARVTLDHLSRRARGLDVLTWLVECWFGAKALRDAQAMGCLPLDEPIDPTGLVSIPHLACRFPLFRSAGVRAWLRQLEARGRIVDSFPSGLQGYTTDGEGVALSYLHVGFDAYAVSRARIYLHDFGITPSEAAMELATVELGALVRRYVRTRQGTLTGKEVAQELREFSATCRFAGAQGGSPRRLPGEPSWRVTIFSSRDAPA
jgi:hypothetical protein